MRKKIFPSLLIWCLCSLFLACSPSQEQTKRLSTKIAGEIYATQTITAKQKEITTPASSPTVFDAPTITLTPTSTQEAFEVSPAAPITGLLHGMYGYPWWNDSVFYEIYVRSFYDSNGDGIGDLNGISEKLDYLNDGDPNSTSDLGISGIWLMPIFPSPTAHKYNTTDFYDIDPEYGTMEEFKNLLEAAHERGIRIIIDLSVNVTSNQHPWFVDGINPASPYHDWYI